MYLNKHSFTSSNHIRDSAWLEHSPFVFWLIDILRPNRIVELGTHKGFSFLSQCQIAKSLSLDTFIYAIDTWKGDEHAGFYGPNVYDDLEEEVRALYPDLGRMVKATFADARSQFDNGSVDLLHIDGRHRYEDVKADFETWQETLSDSGVVLFHDTCVRRDDFGVYKFWSEISSMYPSFEFYHGHGLGVLIVGNLAPKKLTDLCSDSLEHKRFVREAYARLGNINSIQFEMMKNSSQFDEIKSQANLKDHQIAEYHDKIRLITQENTLLQKELLDISAINNSLVSSTSWKITSPLRALKLFFTR